MTDQSKPTYDAEALLLARAYKLILSWGPQDEPPTDAAPGPTDEPGAVHLSQAKPKGDSTMPTKTKTPPPIATDTTASEWITREAAAEILSVNVRTIDRHIKEKRIKTKRPRIVKGRGGIRILVRRSDVDAIANYDPTQE